MNNKIFYLILRIPIFLFVLIIFLFVLLILLYSSGKPKQFADKNGEFIPNSIAEKSFIEIKGKKIWFTIKSKDVNNPVLLYLHGGMPDYFLTQNYPTMLEEIFTVVWMEQRGAGLSVDARFENRQITIDDLIEDTRMVSVFLKEQFAKEKIYLMGHSGGTYLGIKVIEKYPELYEAYLGIAQISNQKLSEKMAYDFILKSYESSGRKRKYVEILLENPVDLQKPLPIQYMQIRDIAMHDLGIGTMRNMNNIVTGLFIPSLFFKEYSISEKLNLWKGKASSGISVLWNEMIDHDLSEESTKFEVPIYIFHGIHDYTCSFDLSKQYYDAIEAPAKGFFVFYESAHSPIFEEPDRCIEIIRNDILQ